MLPSTSAATNHNVKQGYLKLPEDQVLATNDLEALKNGMSNSEFVQASEDTAKEGAPLQSFEKANFEELLSHYEGVNAKVKPTLELAQALLMTSNLKEAAGNIQGITAQVAAKNNYA